MTTVVFTELTIGDAYNFSIVCSIDQEFGLSVGQFVQPDICCLPINSQPVVTVAEFDIPMNMKIHM